ILLRSINRNSNSITKFPVHLNRYFNFVLDQEFLVVLRPALLGNLTRELELLPKLRTQVRCKGIQKNEEPLKSRYRDRLHGGKGVHENHHLRDGGIKRK